MKDGGDAIDDGGQRSTLMSPLVNAMMGYSMLCILAYAVFCHVEDVDQITAIYIIVQIVTTIGYGDITPKLPQTRIFVMCFVIVTLVVLAYVLNLVVQKVTEREETFLMELVESTGNIAEAQSSLREQRVSKERRRLFTASMLFFCALLFGTLFYAASEPCSCSYGMTTIKGCSSVDYDTCIATDGEQKTLVNAMYFSVITLTTVGFGDFTPQTHLGRWVGIFWMIFGVTATANWIGAMSSFLFERANDDDLDQLPSGDELCERLDADHDGHISRTEHHLYLLLKQGIVPYSMLSSLDDHFNKLDVNVRGVISFEQMQERPAPSGGSGVIGPV
mmetsp:Transcript_114003/g.305694  ORF Transcript_114003/g.305694 Transcript_114003/m.305694 type:complete len:333 (-) Transcript_114003:1-999(-)